MARQAAQLVAQGLGGDRLVLLVPLVPLLPVIAAAPAGEHQDAHAVAEFQKMIVFELAFEAHGIEIHVAHVAQFGLLAFGRGAQQHVEGVARAADQDVLAVDVEQAMALGVEFAGDFADAELGVAGVAHLAAGLEA